MISILSVFFLSTVNAFADPPSSILQAAIIKTASGTLNGFTAYSTQDVYELNKKRQGLDKPQPRVARKQTPFVMEPPNLDEIRAFLNKPERQYIFLSSAIRVHYPHDIIITTQPIRILKPGDFKEIQPVANPLNGFQWYGEVNQVTEDSARLLQKPPRYSCPEESPGECCTSYTWLSYNPNYGADELKPVCKGPFDPPQVFEKTANEMQKVPGIIRIGQSTD